LRLTTAKYYTPSGRCIQRDYHDVLEYLTPDEVDEEGEEPSRDTPHRDMFRTDSGRNVYGGGGITPDVVVKAPPLSRFAATLYARGVFFEFAVDYRAHVAQVPKTFQVTPEVREEFFKFVDTRPTPFDTKARDAYAAEKDPSVIDRAIREELMNAVWGRETGYRVSLEGDVQLKKALTVFPEAEHLANWQTTKPSQLAAVGKTETR